MKCDDCGRFTRHTNDVWGPSVYEGPLREVCDDCYRIARRDEEKRDD